MESRDFGKRLRELRRQADFTQRELADLVGVDFTYLSKIESGALPPPSEKVIMRLAKALQADPDEFMTLAGKIPSDIVQILRDREALQLLRSRQIRKERSSGNRKPGYLGNFRRFARVAMAVVLVAVVAASLWFSSPYRSRRWR